MGRDGATVGEGGRHTKVRQMRKTVLGKEQRGGDEGHEGSGRTKGKGLQGLGKVQWLAD